MAATMEAHHGLIQDVKDKSNVLQVLVNENKFNIDASSNLLFLPRNFDLVDATGTVRHAGNHAPVGDAHIKIFNAFGDGRWPHPFWDYGWRL